MSKVLRFGAFFFVKEPEGRTKKEGVERKFAFLSFSKTISKKNEQREQREQQQTDEIFFLDVEFAPKKPSHFLRRRRRTHTDFENAASGDAGEAAALEPRREHVDVGIACSRSKDDDSFPQTSL